MIHVGPRYSAYELIRTTPEFLSQVSRPANVLWAGCDYRSALDISVELMMKALLPRRPHIAPSSGTSSVSIGVLCNNVWTSVGAASGAIVC